MDNPTSRTLAYLLATTIQNDTLDSIAGGAGPYSTTTRHTLEASSDGVHGPKINYDATLDF